MTQGLYDSATPAFLPATDISFLGSHHSLSSVLLGRCFMILASSTFGVSNKIQVSFSQHNTMSSWASCLLRLFIQGLPCFPYPHLRGFYSQSILRYNFAHKCFLYVFPYVFLFYYPSLKFILLHGLICS